MSQVTVSQETGQRVREEEFSKSTVSSGFDYVQGASNSPYIITSSMVREPDAMKPLKS